jgi:Caspase domain
VMMSSRQLVVLADPDVYGIILPRDKMRGRWLLFGFDVWSAVILLTMILGWAGGRENRVALVIGNAAYQAVDELPTPVNDARAIAELLKGAGFSAVELRQNIGNAELRRVIGDFADAVRGADIAVVYYSGHGIEFNGENYLIPVDAKLERDVEGLDLENQAVSLRRVVASLEPAKRLGLVMLDAPRVGLLNLTGPTTPHPIGFTQPDIGRKNANTLIAFANAPGSTRANAEPEKGLFTTALLNHLATPGLDVRVALGLAGQEVVARTDHQQEPLVFGSLGSEMISLVPAATSGVSSNATPPGTRRLTLDARADHETAHHMERTLTSHYSGLQTELARAAQAKLQAADTAHHPKAENPDEGAPQPQPEAAPTTEHPPTTKVAQTYGVNPALVAALAPVTAPGELTNRSSTAMVFAGDVLAPIAPPNRSLQASTTDAGELARLLQLQLHRVGCDPIKINGDWNSQSRRALEAFNRHAGTKLDLRVASLEALDAVKSRTSRICPLICEHGYRARGGSCVEVEKTKTENKPATPRVHRQHVAHRAPPNVGPAPVSRPPPNPEATPPAPDANASTGKNCHTLAAHVFCD